MVTCRIRVGRKPVSTRLKNLPRDSRKVALVRYDSALLGKRIRSQEPDIKANGLKPGYLEFIVGKLYANLSLFRTESVKT